MRISNTLFTLFIGIFMLVSTTWAGGVQFNDGADMSYAVESGWLSKNYDASMEKALKASKEVLDFNRMHIVRRARSGDAVYIKAEVVKTHDDTCWIKFEPNGENSTTVSIRKAYLNDNSLTRKILREIDRKI